MPDAELPPNQNFPFPLSRQFIIIFSLAAAAFFLLLSWVITVFIRGQSFLSLFTSGKSLTEQILLGLLLGVELAIYVALIVGKLALLPASEIFSEEYLAASDRGDTIWLWLLWPQG